MIGGARVLVNRTVELWEKQIKPHYATLFLVWLVTAAFWAAVLGTRVGLYLVGDLIIATLVVVLVATKEVKEKNKMCQLSLLYSVMAGFVGYAIFSFPQHQRLSFIDFYNGGGCLLWILTLLVIVSVEVTAKVVMKRGA